MLDSNETTILDLIVIGAGPAGLAAAVEGQRGQLKNILVLEKGGSHSQMIRTYYKEGKRVDARYAGQEAICFGLLCLKDGNRETYLQMMEHVIAHHNINIHYNTEVWSIESVTKDNHEPRFCVKTAQGTTYFSKTVVVAIGKMGKPKQPDYWMQIPNALKNNGSILFDINTRPLNGSKVLVVGGGDSAAEYAHMLSSGNDVTLSYRQHAFSKMNTINKKNTLDLIEQKKIKVLLPSNIARIEDDAGRPLVTYAESQWPTERYDAILYGLGGMTPVEFLRKAGLSLGPQGDALTNESHESSQKGLYIVGDLLGKGKGGGSIISGFNSASAAVRNLLKLYFNKHLEPELVSLEHLNF